MAHAQKDHGPSDVDKILEYIFEYRLSASVMITVGSVWIQKLDFWKVMTRTLRCEILALLVDCLLKR